MRALLEKILDRIDPPAPEHVVAPCPRCGRDVWKHHVDFRIDPELTFVRCVCGHASAWCVNGCGPQLIYTEEPEETEYD